jgi:hypothetical protein
VQFVEVERKLREAKESVCERAQRRLRSQQARPEWRGRDKRSIVASVCETRGRDESSIVAAYVRPTNKKSIVQHM